MHNDVLEAYIFRRQAALACTQDKSVSFAETERALNKLFLDL